MMAGIMRGAHVTAAQASASMLVGDVVCQCLEQYVEEEDEVSSAAVAPDDDNSNLENRRNMTWPAIDWMRTARMATTGLCVSGPYAHLQYAFLERLVPGALGKAVAKKVLLSAAQAPLSISLMFSSVLLLQNKAHAISRKLADDVVDTWLAGVLYWPAVLALNFRHVPPHRRPLVGAMAGSVWNVYNAFQANKGADVTES